MKSCRIHIVSLILAGLISMPAHGEMISGRWEKVSALELGTPITVELKNGDQVEGTFEVLSASEVELGTHFARAVIPKADIQTIATQKKGGAASGARKGAIIGVATGAAIGVGGLVYAGANRDGGENLRAEVFLIRHPCSGCWNRDCVGHCRWGRHSERSNRGLPSRQDSLESQAQKFGKEAMIRPVN